MKAEVPELGENHILRHIFKKRGEHKKLQSTENSFFKGVAFCISREGPELYMKTIEKLGLYISTLYKN